MSNYSKLTDFASKDTLPSGSAAKIVKGTEIDDEFQAIESAISTKANTDSPALTGTPTAPTATTGTATTQIATTAYVQGAISGTLNASQLTVAGDLTVGVGANAKVNVGNWSVRDTANGFEVYLNSTLMFRIDGAGNVTARGNVTAYGAL